MFKLLFVSLISSCIFVNSCVNDKPNIIVIFLDDLGYADVGFTRTTSEIMSQPDRYWNTPNIDSLAFEGLILSNHYVHAICSPTRAGYLTGRYPWQFGIETALQPFMELGLQTVSTNIPFPLLLSNYANYETYHLGKWDVGTASWSDTPIGYFDQWIGGVYQPVSYYGRQICLNSQAAYWVNELDISAETQNNIDAQQGNGGICFYDMWTGIDIPEDPNMDLVSNQFGEEIYSQTILEFIQDWKDNLEYNDTNYTQELNKDAFFINWQPFSPHIPIQQQVPYNINGIPETYPECDLVTNQGRLFYCKLVQYMDRQIGQVTDLLKSTDLWDNTLILFSSDNGGAPSNGLPVGQGGGNGFGCNLPFRGRKTTSWEGGIHSAAFLSGGYLPSYLQGQSYSSLIGIQDWYSIFTYLADIDLTQVSELNNVQLNSYNMWLDILSSNGGGDDDDETFATREEFVNLRFVQGVFRGCVIRNDGWKYLTNPLNSGHLEFDGSVRNDAPYFPRDLPAQDMLFDLNNDPYETINLASDPSYSTILSELQTSWQGYLSNRVFVNDPRSKEGLKRALDTKKYQPWQDDPEYDIVDQTADEIIWEYLDSICESQEDCFVSSF